ncbi:hypothetical protein SynROS8604_00468 [Synechococcus sp. ROS8604]|nr:hypothetical protein SynROS8604_00468 [Synechococcus sp. ROS8604]
MEWQLLCIIRLLTLGIKKAIKRFWLFSVNFFQGLFLIKLKTT